MNKFKLFYIFLVSLIFCACFQEKTETKQQASEDQVLQTIETANIRLGFSTNLEDPRGVAALQFKEEVESKTSGKIKIDLFANGTLGNDAELIEGIINDKIDMTVSSAGNYGIYATQIGVSALPFLFSSFEQAWAFLDNPIFDKINKTLEEYNMVLLSNFDNGFRCVTTTNKIINTPEDMKALTIRTPPNQIVMETMSELGANPKPYPFTELKEALQQGLFDAQENPIPIIYNSRLYDYQHYLAITNHSYDAMPLVIRKKLWDNLTEENKRIIKEAAINAQNTNRRIVKEQSENYLLKLRQNGMVITYPDQKKFAEQTKDVLPFFSAVFGNELVNKLEEFARN